MSNEPELTDPGASTASGEIADPPARGRLRIYLGAAPGVGKTYAMLQEAQRRKARGADVVVGFVETHGRSQTVEQIDTLEVVPPREVPYRGATIRELDTAAVIARRPGVALVDELAHTNVLGSRHAKRYEDVQDILVTGITVISTLNIQHMESLNDTIRQLTGLTVRETVPDWMVEQAEEVELIDMAPEALDCRAWRTTESPWKIRGSASPAARAAGAHARQRHRFSNRSLTPWVYGGVLGVPEGTGV